MSLKVPVPVLFNALQSPLDNAILSVDCDSEIIGYYKVPPGAQIPGYPKPNQYIEALHIKDSVYGSLYLNMTIEEFSAAAGQVSKAPDATQSVLLRVATNPSDYVTSPSLYAIVPISVSVGIQVRDLSQIVYTSDDATQQGTLTFPSDLTTNDLIQVIFNKL